MSAQPQTEGHHILVVEDDASLANWIADYLTDNGYQVSVASRGSEVVSLVRQHRPDLLILDINLPELDGFSVCRKIREFSDKPVLMLTARGDEADEILGLKAGADDYLIKPVRPKALLTRLELLLRRDDEPEPDTHEYGGFRIDQKNRSVCLNDETIILSSNEFNLLWLLASHAGEIMAREDIVGQLRGIEYDGFDRSVDILVSRVRKKLADNSSKPYRIKTVRGKGYLFAIDAW